MFSSEVTAAQQDIWANRAHTLRRLGETARAVQAEKVLAAMQTFKAMQSRDWSNTCAWCGDFVDEDEGVRFEDAEMIYCSHECHNDHLRDEEF